VTVIAFVLAFMLAQHRELRGGPPFLEGKRSMDAPPPEGFLRPERTVLRHVLFAGAVTIPRDHQVAQIIVHGARCS
jgi:hypothetical protein